MALQFRLRSVLKVRLNARDLDRQSVAVARNRLSEHIAKRNALTNQREAVISELRSINEGEAWIVDQVVARQRHAEQLGLALTLAETAIVEAESQLATCLKKLIFSDQSVRGLERLAERQLAEFQDHQKKSEAREFECLARTPRQ